MTKHPTTCENCIYCKQSEADEIFPQCTCAVKGELIRDIRETCGHFINKDKDER